MPNADVTNPIAATGNDPWVIRHDGAYFYCYSWDRAIRVRRSSTLPGIVDRPGIPVWTPPDEGPYSREIWAPELHRIGDHFFIYFAADDGENANHRMYALESEGLDPIGPYRFRGKVAPETDRWAIDGTVGLIGGHYYFVWSGWPGTENVVQNLYIAPMEDPTTLAADRSLLTTPEHPWERLGPEWEGKGVPMGVVEGPQFLEHDGAIHLIYSANGSWTDDYCLGRLTYLGGPPTSPDSWRKADAPVFESTDQVFGPGHASFVTSPDGSEHWIVYHSAKRKGSGWDRQVRAQRFSWAPDGTPRFGRPLPPGAPIDTEPEGEDGGP